MLIWIWKANKRWGLQESKTAEKIFNNLSSALAIIIVKHTVSDTNAIFGPEVIPVEHETVYSIIDCSRLLCQLPILWFSAGEYWNWWNFRIRGYQTYCLNWVSNHCACCYDYLVRIKLNLKYNKRLFTNMIVLSLVDAQTLLMLINDDRSSFSKAGNNATAAFTFNAETKF